MARSAPVSWAENWRKSPAGLRCSTSSRSICSTRNRTRMATELWQATASELARMVRQKQASPLEIVHAFLSRIDAVEDRVQAWETIDREGALKTAPDVRSAVDLPLRGVPVGIKDIYLTGGLRTTASFPP